MSTHALHRRLACALLAAALLAGCGGDTATGPTATTDAGIREADNTTVVPANTSHGAPTTDPTPLETVAPTTTSLATTVPETVPETRAPTTTVPVEVSSRSAVFEPFPHVALVNPPTTGAGVGPTFEWAPIDGAVSYRLSVLGPDGPIWVWEGAETSVALALRPDPRPASAPALEIVAGSTWSVAALNATGDLVAISGQRPVSP